jgi:diguanylate cyclase (GGDEF)-like protein
MRTITVMKAQSGHNMAIGFVTDSYDTVKAAKGTLSHVYPGVEVQRRDGKGGETYDKFAAVIIDSRLFDSAGLDHMLDLLPDVPSIIVVDDFSSIRNYGKYLTNRRSVITRDDIGGMGLIQATHHLLERQKLHEQLLRTSRHLKELSTKDELTGLFNNRHFQDVLSSEIKKANRYRRPLSLVIISIKNFTAINKMFGHHEGDRLLVKASEAIKGTVRDVDVTARYGDNEIAVILPESSEDAARVVAKRIHDALCAMQFEVEGDGLEPIYCTGIAALNANVKSREELLSTALGALMEAKRSGEHTICTSAEVEAKRNVVRENRQLIEQLNERITRITSEAQRNYFQSIMNAIAEMPLLKRHILPHSERVAFFARRLAESYGLDEAKSKAVYRAGLLHDAGKLAISPDILTKPGRLTLPEQELIQKHPVFGIQIIGSSPFLGEELVAILHHHERFDGEGYPERLSGESIPLSARMIAIAEGWDAMTTPQPYRPTPLTLDAALEEISKGAGTQFDPDIVECFKGLITST